MDDVVVVNVVTVIVAVKSCVVAVIDVALKLLSSPSWQLSILLF